jgi:hypothetical protein
MSHPSNGHPCSPWLPLNGYFRETRAKTRASLRAKGLPARYSQTCRSPRLARGSSGIRAAYVSCAFGPLENDRARNPSQIRRRFATPRSFSLK